VTSPAAAQARFDRQDAEPAAPRRARARRRPEAGARLRPFDPRLLRHASAARGYLIAAVALGLVTTALVLAQATLLARALSGAALGTGLAALRGTVLALLLVVTARAAVAYGGEAAALRAAAAVKSQLRRRLAAHALRLGPAWLTGQQAGEITTLTTRGLDALDPYFARYLPQLVLGCLVPVAVLIRITAADWLSGVVIAVTLPLIPVFGVLIGLYTRAHTDRQWRLLAALGGHFLDVVEGLPTLKLFGRAKAQAAAIGRTTDQHRSATMAALRVAFLSALVLELAGALATALVAVEVGLRLLAGHLGYDTALLVLLLTPEAYLPLRNVGAQFHASAEGTTAAGRALQILDTPLPESSLSAAGARTTGAVRQPDLARDAIELRAVSLRYPSRDVPALDGVTATIRPGEHVLLTGASGAGKSSLLGLLLRFAEPTSGEITAGPTSIAAIPAGWWRQQIAWVPQHPYLFAGTIAENIALGAPAATGAAIAQAARLAGAEDFIAALPGGFSALLSERALELSAGQRQRLALARAFLRDAPLVLLDEPVEHLDPVTARDILDVLGTALAGRTVVMISHRLQLPAGQVLRLDHGRLDHGRLNPAQSGHARPDPAQPGQVKPGDGHLSRAQLAVPGATS
jgi:ATP-binding cassette subfamily C protein CydD